MASQHSTVPELWGRAVRLWMQLSKKQKSQFYIPCEPLWWSQDPSTLLALKSAQGYRLGQTQQTCYLSPWSYNTDHSNSNWVKLTCSQRWQCKTQSPSWSGQEGLAKWSQTRINKLPGDEKIDHPSRAFLWSICFPQSHLCRWPDVAGDVGPPTAPILLLSKTKPGWCAQSTRETLPWSKYLIDVLINLFKLP